MNLDNLRSATRPEHEATERVMPLMDSGLSLELYGAVLRRLYRLMSCWEGWCERHAPADLAEMVRLRRRSEPLEQDLAWLGMAASKADMVFPEGEIPGLRREDARFRASFLGAMYVVEGSTLGGQYIARHVEQVLQLEGGRGNAYFRGYGERTGEMWNAFRGVLSDVPEDQSADVIAAAKAMFRVFREGMLS